MNIFECRECGYNCILITSNQLEPIQCPLKLNQKEHFQWLRPCYKTPYKGIKNNNHLFKTTQKEINKRKQHEQNQRK